MMTQLFASALNDKPLTANQLPEAIHSYRERLAHGLLEIDNVGGGSLTFLFAAKKILTVYARNAAGLISLAPDDWQAAISPTSKSKYLPAALRFSPATFRMVQIRLAQERETETLLNQPAQTLAERLAAWSQCLEPTLLHIRWTNADALIMLRGAKQKNVEVALFSGGQEMPGKTELADLVEWPENEYSLTILKQIKNSAWDTYLLQSAFACMVEALLQRYSEVTGRVLVNSVVRCFNVEAASKDLDINLTNAQIQDKSVFVDPSEASPIYRALLEHTLAHIESLIGRNLVSLILKDTLADMTDVCLQPLINQQIIPEAYVPVTATRSRI